MPDLFENCFVQKYKKLEGCKEILEVAEEWFESDKDLRLKTIIDVVQPEDEDDPIEIDTA